MIGAAGAFTPREIGEVRVAAELARDLTGEHFALSDRWFQTTSHEVCTLRELRGAEIVEGRRLALIRRLGRILGEGARAVCPHYRICLQDHNILGRIRAEPGVRLCDLLTCVLVHEYVHLIRFQRLEHPYHATPGEVAAEEERVRALCHRIVRDQGPARLRPLAPLAFGTET